MIEQKEKPLFQHDCACCTFLGSYKGNDLYHHESPLTLIARFGDDGEEYKSGNHLVAIDIDIAEAHKRASALGLHVIDNYWCGDFSQ